MNKSGKIWGETITIFNKNNVNVSRIVVKKGGYCSKHHHIKRINAFFIEKGCLEISVWKNDYDLIDKTIIKDGEMTMVKPNECHQFTALEDTIAYEIYWVEIDSDDIIRDSHGGYKK